MMTFRNVRVFFCILGAVFFLLNGSSASAEDQRLNLQAIVDQARPGDTILLKPGIYHGPVIINKPLTIRSEGEVPVELRNSNDLPVLTIHADYTTVSGLHIIDEKVKEEPTVLVTGHNAILEGLSIRTAGNGIMVRDADEGTLDNSAIIGIAEGIRMADRGNGVDIFNGHRWNITDNTIRNVHDGIYMEGSDDTLVVGNVIEQSRYGVHCMYTHRTIIQRNDSHLNVTGAMIMTASHVSVIGNMFTKQSENVNSQGILLYDTHESTVKDNTAYGNRVGLYVELSTGNILENNRVSSNFVGLQLIESSGNTIQRNQFIANVADAQARGSEENNISENYWDNFRGIDTDRDGKSEISYSINPFFQGLVQKRPAFQLFFQSPGMVFLEGLYETERERWTTDTAPLMVPPDNETSAGDPEGAAMTGIAGIILLVSTGVLFIWMRRRNI
ncbi:right-handed parallel beta-helix repeat-containing protein [Paenibacillus sp. FSL M8-0334]|nr:right-handed parallel beta-helix repeat-containing protein [Paenibacillus campinasensis]